MSFHTALEPAIHRHIPDDRGRRSRHSRSAVNIDLMPLIHQLFKVLDCSRKEFLQVIRVEVLNRGPSNDDTCLLVVFRQALPIDLSVEEILVSLDVDNRGPTGRFDCVEVFFGLGIWPYEKRRILVERNLVELHRRHKVHVVQHLHVVGTVADLNNTRAVRFSLPSLAASVGINNDIAVVEFLDGRLGNLELPKVPRPSNLLLQRQLLVRQPHPNRAGVDPRADCRGVAGNRHPLVFAKIVVDLKAYRSRVPAEGYGVVEAHAHGGCSGNGQSVRGPVSLSGLPCNVTHCSLDLFIVLPVATHLNPVLLKNVLVLAFRDVDGVEWDRRNVDHSFAIHAFHLHSRIYLPKPKFRCASNDANTSTLGERGWSGGHEEDGESRRGRIDFSSRLYQALKDR
mmetsp:Transcript_7050/g.18302  ORF Transcript_7050/g.18302 Transcript_7050/m.18302 type:complete len:397 (+) Transcript_7050:1317-2507(+)